MDQLLHQLIHIPSYILSLSKLYIDFQCTLFISLYGQMTLKHYPSLHIEIQYVLNEAINCVTAWQVMFALVMEDVH